jgi:phage tail-like protein
MAIDERLAHVDTPELEPHHANGRVLAEELTNGAISSSYLQYLPAPFHADPFMRRFLMIFETVLGPIERTIDNVAYYLDPRLTPPELLPWLASWVGLELDENLPLQTQRQLVLWAVSLYRWRGTRRALREHLRLYTGRTPLIVENFSGLRVGQDGGLGVNTRLGDAPRPHWLTVTVLADRPEELDERIVRQIIELEKPAHVGYTLEIRGVAT